MKNKYVLDMDHYAALARQAAAEGAVLLKNENQVLPLAKDEKISVFGRIQFHYYKSGVGSGGLVNTNYVVGILDALKEEPLQLNEELLSIYENWLFEHPYDFGQGWAQEPWFQEEMPLTEEQAKKAASFSNKAIVILGRTAGEDKDSSATEGSYLLTATEMEMLRNVRKHFPEMIVLLNVGNIIDMKWAEEISPDAILYVWQGGMEGGHGVTDVLMGRVNPCGKLTDTIARDITDYPSTVHFGHEDKAVYAEDIYVGYRYFETFAPEKVLYPFGYGLSYSDFEILPLSCKRQEDGMEFTVQVTNQGTYAGKEVVQIYVSAPQGLLGKPLRSLVAFKKTKVLNPGESEVLILTVSDYQLASYDDAGKTGYRSAYVMEDGTYTFYVGKNVRENAFAGTYEIEQTTVIEQLSESLAPAEKFQRFIPVYEEQTGRFALEYEDVPLRTQSQTEHREAAKVAALPYTGDQGYRLEDVYDNRIDLTTFLAQLTDEDLCHLANGEGMCSPKVTSGTASAFGGLTERLKEFGIPCGCCSDGPSGIRMDNGGKAFSLPGGTCLACTFNEELNEQLFTMEGAELRKNKIDTLLGPGMNIHRNPLNGRNFEYYSEDPYVTGKIAAAQLRGMHSYGVTGTIKHFIANNQEFCRHTCNSMISERAIREIYLKGFEIAVKEAGAYSIMTTYGAVNGVWTAGSYDLCTRILREEWKFDGIVMTDWWAFVNEDGTEGTRDHLTSMVKAQNDIYMVADDTTLHLGDLQEHLADGTLRRGELARNAANICRMLMRSPAMIHFLGRTSAEELEATTLAQSEDASLAMEYTTFTDTVSLPVEGICTDRGSEVMYGILATEPADYEITIQVKIDASELAQIPLSVFLNGILIKTVTMNGTNGKEVPIKLGLGYFPTVPRYIKLYFAQGGMQISSIRIEKV